VSVSRFDITPIRIYGTASVGVYMAANDEYALIPADSPEKVDRHVEDTLKVKVIKLTVGRSPLLGVFTVMNNSGVLVPSIIRDEELEQLRKVPWRLKRGGPPIKVHSNSQPNTRQQ